MKKEILNRFEKFRYKYDMTSVFCDFISIAAISLSNQVDLINANKREEEFYNIQKKYKKEEFGLFVEILSLLQMGLMKESRDLLGEIYMEINLNKKGLAQFFTPYSISKACAEMSLGSSDFKSEINKRGFIKIGEPCCGSGGMCIAINEVLLSRGLDIKTNVLIIAQDIDRLCVMMTYIQLSLLGVPAIIKQGNSLLLEVRDTWYTPAFMVYGWPQKLLIDSSNINDKAI